MLRIQSLIHACDLIADLSNTCLQLTMQDVLHIQGGYAVLSDIACHIGRADHEVTQI